ncbi:XK-related protein 8-like [Boleophthalmus pectinirostris]|uniref:XK-related protein 8-like n=1 Tax=Boleophthalmus pectinirostris TaxID=150288 RepID=UPI000A1C6F3C|nr:XK-related protein 8-like [Boleophthalmus pectinirostris]
MAHFEFQRLDFFLTIGGLVALILDIILDVYTALDFYNDWDYIRLGAFVFFLIASSLLVQTYSWLWYKYDGFEMITNVEKIPSFKSLKVLHILQLGTYLRHMGVMETAICKYLRLKGVKTSGLDPGDAAVCLSHDVAMLRIVEAFSESLPQLVLMVTTHIQRGQLHAFPILKAVASAFFVSMTVMSYHRSLRSFLKDKHEQTIAASAIYLIWNLLLISARVSALALFTSELPCYICTHFLCSWFVLFIFVWCTQTNFMNSKGGEVLYRGTVALIWYFNWFNVVKGDTLRWTIIYHGYIVADITLLWGLWFWKINSDLTNFNYEHLIAYFCILFFYIIGIGVKSIYYYCFHPKVTSTDLQCEEDTVDIVPLRRDSPEERVEDVPDNGIMFRMATVHTPGRREPGDKVNMRMRKLAENFYS